MRPNARARKARKTLIWGFAVSTTVLLAFIATCLLLALTPGPNMSLIIANTLSGGMRAGFVTLAGSATGLSILAATAAIGMSSVMVFMGEWFDVIRWAGALYLVALGVRQLLGWYSRQADAEYLAPKVSATSAYAQGLIVSVSNPKVLLFLGAFLPQFLNPEEPTSPQLAVLAVTFVATLIVVDSGYTYAIGRARQSFDMKRLAILDGIAGGLLVIGGLVLATARRPV